MTERASTLVTLLFTDLVSSTELLARAGDEQAERVFRAHHKAATTHGRGGEVARQRPHGGLRLRR